MGVKGANVDSPCIRNICARVSYIENSSIEDANTKGICTINICFKRVCI